ncbi:MAG TPA: hypothetical protein ENN99_15325 [Chloroflexi bacterium]|nr:hypothetical protein [Chloroflexota bacterium]
MIEVHLYGRLRRHVPNSRPDQESVVRLIPRPGETIASALERVGISSDDVCHVFLNGALLSTRNSMAPWLEYQRVGGQTQGLDTSLQPGDRLGLFAHDIALLVV